MTAEERQPSVLTQIGLVIAGLFLIALGVSLAVMAAILAGIARDRSFGLATIFACLALALLSACGGIVVLRRSNRLNGGISNHAGSGRSMLIVVVAGYLLLALALINALIAALYGYLLSMPGNIVLRIGGTTLAPELAHRGALVFFALCLLSGYAGLAAILRWQGWKLFMQAGAWSMIGLGIYGLWIYLSYFLGLPYPIPLIYGIGPPPYVSLLPAMIGIFVLWTVSQQVETTTE